MDYKIVPKKYRPIPFWSWNEKLDVSETKRQAEEMNRIGMGGFLCTQGADFRPSI